MEKANIDHSPPNAMCRDLGFKFRDDQLALISRHLAIMIPEIGSWQTMNIIFTVLANIGLMLEDTEKCRPGSFMSIVATADEEMKTTTKEGLIG